jgi:pyridoxine 4-dehydrogenase
MNSQATAANAGTIDVGGDLTVNRLGFGAMRITGPGIWGDPPDRDMARAALRRAVELGVTFIDTADSYGPEVSENLIAETLYPYPDDLVIATKGGLTRPRPGTLGTRRTARTPPAGLRGQPAAAAARPDPAVPVPPARSEGPDRGVDRRSRRAEGTREDPPRRGLQLLRGPVPCRGAGDAGRARAEPLNAADRSSESMVDLCEQEQLVFLPWAPVLDTERNTAITDAARRHGASPQQIVLAWLLARSPPMLPIPGSGSPEHVAQNVAAASIALSDDEVAAISKGG